MSAPPAGHVAATASPQAAPRAGGIVLIVMTLVGWSSVPLFLRHFVDAMDPFTSNGWRYGFAALLWAPVAWFGLPGAPPPRGLWRASLLPAAVNAIGQVFFTWAHYRVEPGLLSFGLRTQIVFVALGAYLLFPAERGVVRSRGFWAGIALVLAGTAGTVLLGPAAPRLDQLSGVAMAVAAGAFFAAYGLSVRHALAGYPSLPAFAVISQSTALAMLVLMFAFGERAGSAPLSLPPRELTLLALSAVIGIALGHVFYYASIKRLGVAASSGVLQLQPICVALGSAALFGERLTGAQWAAGALAIAGAVTILAVQREAMAHARRHLAGR